MPAIREIKKFRWFAPMLIIMVSVFAAGCSDDDAIPSGETVEEQVDSSAISLTYHDFTGEDDVIIMDADTTQISVSKDLADKLGIVTLMAVLWQFGRKPIACLTFAGLSLPAGL